MTTQKQQRIFITGATGYIGLRVTEFALSKGYLVHGLSRSAAGTAKLESLGAVPVPGDLLSLSTLRMEAAQSDVVIHLADAWIDDFSQPYEKIIAIDAAAVDAMTQGLAESKKTRKLLIDTSGVGVVKPDDHDAETDEKSPIDPNPMNGRIHRERYNLSKAGEGGVRVCVMRLPPFVYGRGSSGIKMFMHIFAKLGLVVRVGDGTTRTSVVHVDDAARAYLLVVQHACLEDGDVQAVYNVTSSTEVTFRELTAAMADTMGLPLREMSFIQAAAEAGPLVAGFLSLRVRGKSDKARQELGWAPVEAMGIIEDIRNGSYVDVAKEIMAAAQESKA
ncbi:putative NAD dependent epimerase/dehydratase [Xylaria sp. CBS 124048]|nr:putative NAD dependent epimerase/dehydratase [Xylaria sp. CBS 124048]